MRNNAHKNHRRRSFFHSPLIVVAILLLNDVCSNYLFFTGTFAFAVDPHRPATPSSSATTTAASTTCDANPSYQNSSNDSKMKYRTVQQILPRPPSHWVGDGFKVYPVFANKAFTEAISPLLMFDYAEPKLFEPRGENAKPLGVGQHPHRGFETVTIAFQGEVEHHDSTGRSGIIKPGDVQWMTAGRGIIHQEYHSKQLTKEGGTFEVRSYTQHVVVCCLERVYETKPDRAVKSDSLTLFVSFLCRFVGSLSSCSCRCVSCG